MDFIELINGQRECYLKQLTEFYRERSGAKEILLELDSDEQEKVFRLYRLDYYEEGKPTELSPDRYLNYPMTLFKMGNLEIEMNPFYWHGCDFSFEKEIENIDWLKLWTATWIDIVDTNSINAQGFSEVIHNVTRPRKNGSEWEFAVDFGTATSDAFIELLKRFDEKGIMRVRIGSFQMIPK